MSENQNEFIEKLKNDWHLAGVRIQQIGEFVDKVRRFQYRSRLKQETKPIRKYENALYSLFLDINLYIDTRNHTWEAYGKEGVDSEEDIRNLFDEVDELLNNNEESKAIEKLELLDRIINYGRIKEGFDIPKQTQSYNPNHVSTENRGN